jgi:hypothetical protein
MHHFAYPLIGFACAAGVAAAQGAPTPVVSSTPCDSVLSAPTTDSVDYRVDVYAEPFDSTQWDDHAYLRLLQQGIAQYFVVPQPLPLDTYEPDVVTFHPGVYPHLSYATATPLSHYRVELHRDGRVTGLRLVAGVHSAQFLTAMAGALTKLDTALLLPPFPDGAHVDSVDLHLTVSIAAAADVRERATLSDSAASGTGLFLLRLPALVVTKPLAELPGMGAPLYPDALSALHPAGQVFAEFVVLPDGSVEPETVWFMQVSAVPFAQSVLDYLHHARFRPMEIGGCRVRAVVRMPFRFGS